MEGLARGGEVEAVLLVAAHKARGQLDGFGLAQQAVIDFALQRAF